MHRAIKVFLLICLTFIISCSVKRDDTTILQKPIDIDYLIDQNLKNSAHRKSENTILLLLPLSGMNEKLGNGILNACMLAVKNSEHINADFQVIDTANSNLEKNQLYKKFKNQNLIAIIGPVFFNEARQYGALFPSVPIFTFSNNLKANNDHIFTCGLSPQDEISKIFSYAKSKEIDNFLVLLPESEYGDEILNCIKTESKFNLDDIEFIRYRSISKKNAMKCVKNSGKKAVFIVDPILDIKQLEEIQVFTLSAHAIDSVSDPGAWDGAIFAFPDSEKLSDFTTKYKTTFGSVPSILDIIGYDIFNAIFYSIPISSTSPSFFLEKEYSGCLGKFSMIKNKGLKRKLELFRR